MSVREIAVPMKTTASSADTAARVELRRLLDDGNTRLVIPDLVLF